MNALPGRGAYGIKRVLTKSVLELHRPATLASHHLGGGRVLCISFNLDSSAGEHDGDNRAHIDYHTPVNVSRIAERVDISVEASPRRLTD